MLDVFVNPDGDKDNRFFLNNIAVFHTRREVLKNVGKFPTSQISNKTLKGRGHPVMPRARERQKG